jgi:hypothetical protein
MPAQAGFFLWFIARCWVVFLLLRWHPRYAFVLQASPRTGATLERQTA